jgi:transmembrane sensor
MGKELTEVEDRLLGDDTSIEEAREEFIRRVAAAPSGSSDNKIRRLVPALAATAAVVAVSVCALLYLGHSHTSDVPVGRWLQAPPDGEFPLEFSGGDRIVFAAGSRCRVAELNDDSVIVVLENGSANVNVRHRDATDWRVNAGPYEVRVTGTRFTVEWRPNETRFALNMIEGDVLLKGPLVADGQRVTANQSFSANISKKRAQLFMSEDGKTELPVDIISERKAEAFEEVKAQPEARNNERATSTSTVTTNDAEPGLKAPPSAEVKTPNWLEKAGDGKYEEAVGIVVDRGMERTLSESDSTALLLLGDAARLIGRLEMASASYRKLRERFPGTGRAATAAFSLGRMAFDQQGNCEEAILWLEVYLAEQSGATLSREALGRLMEAQIRCSRTESAKQTARRYLNSYANGPHGQRASELLGEAGQK